MAKYCKNCGKQLDPSGRCLNCGWYEQPAPRKRKRHVLSKLILLLVIVFVAACALQYFQVIHVDQLQEVLNLVGLSKTGASGVSGPSDYNRPSAEEYLSDLGTVGDSRGAGKAKLLTEAEACREYAARGFENVTVTACYDKDGNYLGDMEISDSGTEKHPYYEAGYLTPDGAIWIVTLMEDSFFASPFSFNAAGVWNVSHTVCENGSFFTYDGAANAYYQVTPDPNALVLKRVDRIDAETLDQLTPEEVAEP